ncbi:MAG: RHS repeat-associated core domain-containing protein [Clostridiaceae bacterium]
MAYDGRGFITAETAYTNYGSAQTVNKSYTYDAVGRLTQAVIGSDTQSYTYDKVGNRLTMNDGTDTYAYNYDVTGFNQLVGIVRNGQNYASYSYDDRGNQTRELIQKNFGGAIKTQTTDYAYDLLNVLTGVAVTALGEASQNETNLYNAEGQRVKRIENGETTKYYYSGNATLFTANENNWLLTENLLDLSGSIVASARFDDHNPNTTDNYAGKFFFYHYEMRGSTTAIIQPDGTLIKGYSYDAFGSLKQNGASEFLNDVTFTGSISDLSTGLQYMNARFYNPSTGRFLSQDSYGGNPYDPWTQHLYNYCGNNPTSMIDPTGHVFNLIAAAIGAVGGALIGVVVNGVANALSGRDFFENSLVAAAGGAITGLAAGFT